MKLDKKKVVFGSIIALVVAFIIGYAFLILGDDNDSEKELRTTLVPELPQETEEFKSRKEAVDAIKEERERYAPSVYDEKLLDSTGRFDPDLLDKEKQRVVDSIYRLGRIDYTSGTYRNTKPKIDTINKSPVKKDTLKIKAKEEIHLNEMALEQQLFFAVSPNLNQKLLNYTIPVTVDGEQTVKANDRLQLRTIGPIKIGGVILKKGTRLYGIVRFQPNRLVLQIQNINHEPIQLAAYDIADGLEGIYIKNSFRDEVAKEVLGDVVEDINVPGVPQVRGLKNVFRRNNRNVKVTVNDNYRLLLKAVNN